MTKVPCRLLFLETLCGGRLSKALLQRITFLSGALIPCRMTTGHLTMRLFAMRFAGSRRHGLG